MKKLFITFVVLVCGLVTFANPVSLELAQNVGAKFVAVNGYRSNDLQLVTTYQTNDGTPVFYVFNTSTGYVIVSADDCATPILAYSDEGQLDINNVPEQMEAYLQGFVEQIQYGIENHLVADEQVARQWVMVQQNGRINDNRNATAVNPLLTDIWNQDCYYNDLCPTDSQGPCGHVYAGCTGTSMGQIMHFWGYPETGNGSTTYTPSGYPQQSVNFGATTYQWTDMPDALTGASSQTQRTAVATLLWHCGVALHCNYGPNGTSAIPSDVPNALRNYFRYASTLYGQWKSNNTTWLNQVKACLDQGRPLHYSAWTVNNEGHSFVCDGYNSSDQLHFNWGWSGYGNGYFALTALNVAGYEFNNGHYAVFDIHPQSTTNYTITTSSSPTNGGSTTGGGTFTEGQSCTVHATANSGYTFTNWTENGSQVSTNANYTFTVTANRTLVANFTVTPTYTVTTTSNPSEGGTTTGGGTFQQGQSCTVHATANTGYVFTNWTENGSQVSTNANYTFTVNANRNLVANFTQNNYTITTSSNPTEGGTTTGGGTFQQGQSCTVHATANTGYSFVNWTENGSHVSANANYTFTVNANRNLVANFTQNNYTITTSSNPTNGGTTTGGGTFHYGETCTLTATPTDGYSFVKWTQNGNQVSTQPSYSFTVTANASLVAHFEQNHYQVVVESANEEMGTVTGGGSFTYGQTCVVVATPNQHFDFVSWTENSEIVSDEATYSFTITDNHNLVANFDYIDYEISAVCNPVEGGLISGSGTYHYGDEVTLSVNPNTCYFFDSWTENGDTISIEPQITFTVQGNRSLVANLYYFDAVNDQTNEMLNIYPNPADEVVNIEGAVQEVKIFNTLGQLVISEQSNGQQQMQVNISALEVGIYTLMISTEKGTIERQIIKK